MNTMDKPTPTARKNARFNRQIAMIERRLPRMASTLRFLTKPQLRLVRIPVAVVLILGSFLAILPVFGLWMMPVGLILLAIDVPPLKGPVASTIIKLRRRLTRRRK